MDEAAIQKAVAESVAIKQRFFQDNSGLVVEAGHRIAASLREGGRVLIFGNGGSAADAQHFAGELIGRFRRERPGLAALALTTDPSVMTAIGNDFGYEQVFTRQVQAHGRPKDVAFGISTSGRSPNVIDALRYARSRGLVTIGLTGKGGGAVREHVDLLLDVPHEDTQRIQEVHGLVVHILCEVIEDVIAS